MEDDGIAGRDSTSFESDESTAAYDEDWNSDETVSDESEVDSVDSNDAGGFDDPLGVDRDHDEDEGAGNPSRRARIVATLSLLLAALVLNLAYGIVQLRRMHDNGRDDRKIETKYDRKLEDVEYNIKANKHATRIYTHSSLSSKNYRAGGVVSDYMLQRYEEDGAIVVRNLISPKLLDRLDEASKLLIEQNTSSSQKRRGKQFHMVKNGAMFLGVPDMASPVCDEGEAQGETCMSDLGEEGSRPTTNTTILSSFRDLAMYSKLPRVAASLLRLDEIRMGGEEALKPENKGRRGRGAVDESVNLRVARDIFLTKDDDDYACGWHVDDTGFWPCVANDPGVNAWVALDDMPWKHSRLSVEKDGGGGDDDGPVATFALSLGSHRTPWRHEAYEITGSTHTMPEEGFQSASDIVNRRSGSGTCNIRTSAPHLYDKLEENKAVYDLKRGDVIFHNRWLFHRTVTTGEYDEVFAHQKSPAKENKIFRRYSIRYSPGSSTVPPGYGVELSVLHDEGNANRSLDDIVERSGLPWYPKVWPHVVKEKPIKTTVTTTATTSEKEEIRGITELAHLHIPEAEEKQKWRKKDIQRILNRQNS